MRYPGLYVEYNNLNIYEKGKYSFGEKKIL